MQMSPEKKQEIINTLQSKGAIMPCPRCTNNNFTLLDGYFNQPIQQELTGMRGLKSNGTKTYAKRISGSL
jgi:hypothetical protein